MLNNIKQLIGALKTTRKEKKLSQKKLAKKVGLPQSHISKIEAGRVNMKLGNFVEMARLLGLEVMLVPRGSLAVVKSWLASKKDLKQGEETRPLYTLDEEDDHA